MPSNIGDGCDLQVASDTIIISEMLTKLAKTVASNPPGDPNP